MSDADNATSTVDWRTAGRRSRRFSGIVTGAGLLAVVVLSVPASLVASTMTSSGVRFPLTGAVMLVFVTPVVLTLWRVIHRQYAGTTALMRTFEQRLTAALTNAEVAVSRRDVQVRRQEFETRLANALEMAEGEPEVLDVVARALATTAPEAPIELLLADNSHAHLTRMVVSPSPELAPMCGVDSPQHCPAARRAQVQRFDDSEALDACPKLRDRPQGACSATCVPVSIMGRTVGVVHATGTVGDRLGDSVVQDLATLANLAGARIGLLRMVAETQLQAATDSLTGLLNRRSLEKRVSVLRRDGVPFVVVMADLDHFKRLNDTYGHETGDRALRLFAQTLAGSFRSQDIVCRHGGEEFAVVLPGCTAHQARAGLEGMRDKLANAFSNAGLPQVTASFGVIETGEQEDLASALSRADVALFQAKRDGRDRIVVHDSNSLVDHHGSSGQAQSIGPDSLGATSRETDVAA